MPQLSGCAIGDGDDGGSGEHNHRAVCVEVFKEGHQKKMDAEYDEVLALPIFAAGQYVSPGVYHRVGSNFIVRLHSADFLPASLDGKIAHFFLDNGRR